MTEPTPIEAVVPETADAPPASPVEPKRKTSRRLREGQRLERRLSKATHRLAKAAEKGVAKYRRARDRSSQEKRDGALRDLTVNVAEGMSAALREASRYRSISRRA